MVLDSGQNLAHRAVILDACQPHVEPLELVRQPLVIDAEALENRAFSRLYIPRRQAEYWSSERDIPPPVDSEIAFPIVVTVCADLPLEAVSRRGETVH